jgi:hypothetical protein
MILSCSLVTGTWTYRPTQFSMRYGVLSVLGSEWHSRLYHLNVDALYSKRHMKCISFYCNIAHEPKGRGMKSKRIWVGYMIEFSFVPLQFPNLSTWSATVTVIKMASQADKVKRVLWFHESRYAVTVQRRFRTVFGREPPTKISIFKWYKLLGQTGCICEGRSRLVTGGYSSCGFRSQSTQINLACTLAETKIGRLV